LVELHDSIEDCPELILVGLADSEAVVAGSAVVKDPAVQGVNVPEPQQVLKMSPFTTSEGSRSPTSHSPSRC